MKIGLIGCPGTGKTSIAFEVSKHLGIPPLYSRDLTKPILERDGYSYAPNNFVENFLACKLREFELVKKRLDIERINQSFVSDRTTLENYAYSLLAIETYSETDMNWMCMKCMGNIDNYDYLFYFPRSTEIRNNGKRTLNLHLHAKIDYIIQGIIRDWELPVINIPEFVKDKVKFILDKVNHSE